MSGKKEKKGSKSQAPAVMSPFMFMPPEMLAQWQAQMAIMSNTPSTSGANKAATVSKAPWSSDSSSSEDEDLQTPAKKPKLPMAKAPNFQKDVAQQATKRKVGRSKKIQRAVKEKEKHNKEGSSEKNSNKNIVDNYPSIGLLHEDKMAHSKIKECKCCKIWKGLYAILPCGHAKYCNYCITKLKEEAQNMKRPSKCHSDDCYTLVTSWVKLFNISP